jgi:hypothetical protein
MNRIVIAARKLDENACLGTQFERALLVHLERQVDRHLYAISLEPASENMLATRLLA